ncbi:TPA: hypothetical protein O4H83_001140 [Vibrio cholerae]|uniref:hypothetical protein n=1 Tax=Vibrio cholerae TaxID=666 RepID=UPI0021CF1465|nr:hypothetical protein [Vibrio cholerae]MCU4218848.1 hypothetical protein [Vibrio cholerae]HCZ9602881.1 hypothetical protein [Vibrio cholerae]HCZ9635935.1 hypothetical protein [Vibrio cholerae]HCZ9643289.1 hypothetical protein [Vibrio cholerae]
MFELTIELLQNPIFTGVFGVLTGALLGHRFALSRDKRKEHNEVVVPLKRAIQESVNKPSSYGVDAALVHAVQFKISDTRYHKLTKEYGKYSELMREAIYPDDWGVPQLKNEFVPKIVDSLNKMDSLLTVR